MDRSPDAVAAGPALATGARTADRQRRGKSPGKRTLQACPDRRPDRSLERGRETKNAPLPAGYETRRCGAYDLTQIQGRDQRGGPVQGWYPDERSASLPF